MNISIMRVGQVAALLASIVALESVGSLVAAESFTPHCTLPATLDEAKARLDRLASRGADLPMIVSCGPEGVAATPAHRAQNAAKNEFCAAGRAAVLRHSDFVMLQREAERRDIRFGSANRLPEDRAVLRDMVRLPNGAQVGEGSLVRHVAFLSHPRYSNTGKGESVNCKHGGAANNDIHVDLVAAPDDPACRSITAEISPHFRPRAWERDVLDSVRDRPLRVTGHLFFDAAHRPCRNDNDRVQPMRASLWEIHPVYAIDVCRRRTLSGCRATDESVWIALESYRNVPQEEEDDD